MPRTGFWRAVLVNLARTDAPFAEPATEPATEPSPLLVALARETPAFGSTRPATGRWWPDLRLALARITPAYTGAPLPAPSPVSAPQPEPSAWTVPPGPRVGWPVPAPRRSWGVATVVAGAFASVSVALLGAVMTAFWLAPGSAEGPGGPGASPRPTGSPVVIDVPDPVEFVTDRLDDVVVLEGTLSGERTVSPLDVDPVHVDVTMSATYSAVTLGPGLAGATLTSAAQAPADCLTGVRTAPLPERATVTAVRGVVFCAVARAATAGAAPGPVRVVRFVVTDVAKNGSVTLRISSWSAVSGLRFTVPPGALPGCASVTGTGAPPATGRVVLFVSYAADTTYYYEAPLTFLTDGTWTVPAVMLGGDTDGGVRFVLSAVRVSEAVAAELATHSGTPSAAPALPGPVLARVEVTRAAGPGSC